MRTPIHSSYTGRELIARGPMQLTEDEAAYAVAQLKIIGIGMDAALVGPAGGNLGAPLQFLQTWLPGVVRQVTQIRNADALMGVQTVGAWDDEEIVQTVSELTGKAELYGDTTNIPLASYNPTYERRSVLRWEQGMMVGKLEEARAARQNFAAAVEKRAAAADALDITRNRVAFLGYNQPDTRVFGYLNDPLLPAYVNVAAGTAGLPWSGKTFNEITVDIREAVTALVTQSGGRVRPQAVDMVLAIPLGFEEYMGVVSDFGNSVGDWLTKTYPRIRVESAPELTGANGGANVFYLYAERVEDSGTDGGEVIVQMVPARFQMIGTETRAKGVLEDYTNALAGVMCKRPYAVVRRSGI